MALPIPPINPNNPIPNNPFYSDETTYFEGPYYPAIVDSSSGLIVNPDGTITITGGGGGVSTLTAGPGIALSGSTGAVTVSADFAAGTNIVLTQVGNQLVISSSGGGTGSVTAIAVGTGLTATSNPITTSGSISLNTACVIPPSAFAVKGDLLVGTGSGTYTALPTGTDGQVLLACSGSGATGLCWGGVGSVTSVTGTAPIAVATGTTTPVISIASSSTTASGAVQLYDDVNSTSTTLALTAAQGKVLQDQITALATTPNIDLAGTIDASTGLVESVTSVGTTAGYTVGAVLPAADATTVDTYVVVTTPGTLTPPGGSATVATRGDWFLVSETAPGVYAWQFLNVGFDAPAATTTVAGIVCLSTDALAQAGTDGTTALTPSAAAAAYIPKTCVTAKGALITGTAASTPIALGVGTDGQILAACSTAITGLCWVSGIAQATPVDLGTVYACTTVGIAAVGFCSARNTTGTAGDSVAVGVCSLFNSTAPNQVTAVGSCALLSLTTGCQNVAVGNSALASNITGQGNSALGWSSLSSTTGCFNTALGNSAGSTVTSGICNVLIGSGAQPTNPTDSCTLRIGWGTGNYWICGDSTKAIKPGAGIVDCANSCGSNGQVLTSTGSALQWRNLPGCQVIRGSSASITYGAGFVACTVRYNIAINDTTGWYNGTTGVFQPNIAGYYQISATARSFVSSGGESYVQLTRNGTAIATSGAYGQVNGTVSTLVCMNGATDTLQVQILASGSGTGCVVGQGSSRFSAMLMALA